MVKMANVNCFSSSNLGELVNKLIAQLHEKDRLIHSLEEENQNLKECISNFKTDEDQIVEYENWLETDEADLLAKAYKECNYNMVNSDYKINDDIKQFKLASTDYSGFENNTYNEV